MDNDAPELDEEVMRKLYAFGGLLAYRVSYFDPMRFEVAHLPMTFHKATAKAALAAKKRDGFTAGMAEFLVRFDGAYAKTLVTDRGN
jgi:hypothetical protein